MRSRLRNSRPKQLSRIPRNRDSCSLTLAASTRFCVVRTSTSRESSMPGERNSYISKSPLTNIWTRRVIREALNAASLVIPKRPQAVKESATGCAAEAAYRNVMQECQGEQALSCALYNLYFYGLHRRDFHCRASEVRASHRLGSACPPFDGVEDLLFMLNKIRGSAEYQCVPGVPGVARSPARSQQESRGVRYARGNGAQLP